MKTKFLLSFFIFVFALHFAQTNSMLIGFGETNIVVSNNYFSTEKKTENILKHSKIPWENQSYDVFGSKFEISANVHSLRNSFVLMNVDRVRRPEYQFDQLQFQITKNNKIVNDWENINARPTFIADEKETKFGKVSIKASKTLNYSLFKDDLVDKDVIKISFRNSNGILISTSFFRKKTDDVVPFQMGGLFNYDQVSLESFVQSALKAKREINSQFYQDWPSSYTKEYKEPHQKVDENTRIALFFRSKATDSKDMLLYRMLENGKPTSDVWKKADDFIVLGDFKNGVQYTLQVKYKDGTQFIERKFFTDLFWYQNIWAKIVAGLLLISMLGLSFLYFRNRKIKIAQREQKMKMQFLSSQLNPHFVFNALNSIQGLVNSGNNEKANLYLTEFAKLMRNIVDDGQKDLITLQKDVDAMKHYISLEQLRYPFHIKYEVEPNLDTQNIEVVPMLIQPILENAVKYGVSELGEKGEIELSIYSENKNMVYQIKDNGQGYDINAPTKGVGLKLTKDRINIFNATSKFVKIDFQMKSSSDGTLVTIIYKNILSDD